MCEHGRVGRQCKECGGSSICEHGRRRTRCKDCARAPARRATARASEAGAAGANERATDDSGYEMATYADGAAPNYARPRKKRAVVKQEHGYDTATYTKGPNHVRPLARPKVKEEKESD